MEVPDTGYRPNIKVQRFQKISPYIWTYRFETERFLQTFLGLQIEVLHGDFVLCSVNTRSLASKESQRCVSHVKLGISMLVVKIFQLTSRLEGRLREKSRAGLLPLCAIHSGSGALDG